MILTRQRIKLYWIKLSSLIFFPPLLFAQTKIDNLQCEHLINPLGIDASQPRFSWQLKDQHNGTKQIAYQISIGKDSVFTWKTEKIKTDSQFVVYNGKPLKPFTK